MRYVKWSRAILTYTTRYDFATYDNRIDMENASFDKTLDQKLRRMITPGVAIVKVCQNLPDLFGSLTFANAEGRNLIPRLNYPGGGNVSEKRIDVVRMKCTREFRARNPGFRRYISHRQLVAKTQG